MILCTTAVGENYNKFVLDFLKTNFSSKFKIHILTDRPELYHSVSTNLYFKPTFSYFDKITYGVTVIDKLQLPGFIVDADDLMYLEGYYHWYNINENVVQYERYWNSDGKFGSILPKDEYFWNFIKDFFVTNDVPFDSIYLVLEKCIFLPKLDYKKLIFYFEKLRYLFEQNSIENGMHKGGVGNGEGVAFGYALYMSGLNHKRVV